MPRVNEARYDVEASASLPPATYVDGSGFQFPSGFGTVVTTVPAAASPGQLLIAMSNNSLASTLTMAGADGAATQIAADNYGGNYVFLFKRLLTAGEGGGTDLTFGTAYENGGVSYMVFDGAVDAALLATISTADGSSDTFNIASATPAANSVGVVIIVADQHNITKTIVATGFTHDDLFHATNYEFRALLQLSGYTGANPVVTTGWGTAGQPRWAYVLDLLGA